MLVVENLMDHVDGRIDVLTKLEIIKLIGHPEHKKRAQQKLKV